MVLFIPILSSPFTIYSLQPPINSYHYRIITLMMTAWAGRLTPQANVAVHTRHLMKPSEKYFSTKFLSCLNIPAWCIPSLRRKRTEHWTERVRQTIIQINKATDSTCTISIGDSDRKCHKRANENLPNFTDWKLTINHMRKPPICMQYNVKISSMTVDPKFCLLVINKI